MLLIATAFTSVQVGCDGDPELPEPIDTTTTVNPPPPVDIEQLKMNELQAVGSHNSYRIKTHAPLLTYLIGLPSPPPGLEPEELDYTHETLPTQFDSFNVRSIEIDIYYDPAGGAYYERQGNTLISEPTSSGEPDLLNPGMKVLHIVDVDYLTHHLTFVSSLTTIKNWSDANPNHLPLIVIVEAKEQSVFTTAESFTAAGFDELDAELASVFGPSLAQVVTPDNFKGTYGTPNDAAVAGAWPTLAESRGTIYFVLMLSTSQKAIYLNGHPALAGRNMFLFGDSGNAETAFIKIDDPTSTTNQEKIMNLVQAGYMVRTRCDAGTVEARNGDNSKMLMAFSSGAQILSTDYYRPDARALTDTAWSDYSVRLPNNDLARLNPVNGPAKYIGSIINE